MEKQDFYTFREYMNRIGQNMTASMEDYLEMIYRLSQNTGYTRMHELATALNVHPPAATRMVQKLAELKLVKYEKYGILVLDELGKEIGAFLYARHTIVENFLRNIGIKEENILEETEKIEHTISNETLNCFSSFVNFYNSNVKFQAEYALYNKTVL
jgi:Mn-dependent DtxR family transcriptional regulator